MSVGLSVGRSHSHVTRRRAEQPQESLGVDYDAMFADDLCPKLEKELTRFGSQKKDIWKLPLDSIEGPAHFKSVHPGLREQFVDQSSACGSWGFYPTPPQGAGEAGAQ